MAADHELLEEKIGRWLREQGLKLAVAESCTGGLVADRLTDVPGSSEYFLGGIIAYAYEAKVALLGVSWETLQAYGAVSRETVLEMARGVRRAMGADVHRQERHVRAHREEVPAPFRAAIPIESHRKAADYTVARTRFGRAAAAWEAVVLLGLTLGGGLDLLGRAIPGDGLLAGTAFVLEAFLAQGLLLLPLGIHATFGIEKRFGFNRTTPGLFALDLAKGVLLSFAIGGPLAAGALTLVAHGGRFWWLLLWAGWVAVSLLLMWAYPALIAPLFDRFRPLEDAALRERRSGS